MDGQRCVCVFVGVYVGVHANVTEATLVQKSKIRKRESQWY